MLLSDACPSRTTSRHVLTLASLFLLYEYRLRAVVYLDVLLSPPDGGVDIGERPVALLEVVAKVRCELLFFLKLIDAGGASERSIYPW